MVFDSHSRNTRGMNDPFGTCVLLELASVDELVEYFQNLYVGRNDTLYEVKGVQKEMNSENRYLDVTTSDIRATLVPENNDIEINIGRNVIDSSKTICAPYSQGDTSVFGRNAGTQCVAMSLSAILYNFSHSIKSSSDLVDCGDNEYRQ
ncbi:hypothetical protein OS493_031777 [Desmophyllum pertusum]|uniref:Uncharacterized protein n=1 Tax=Desmophyllum pertusum TaxID=174260 RepID=A0A9W9ZA52_9CNID|nr:hypothetical protein OS493_031777 [Desmophyllum pertusum]